MAKLSVPLYRSSCNTVVVAKEFGKLMLHAHAQKLYYCSLKIPAIAAQIPYKMADKECSGATLRHTLIECLTDILSPEQHIRSSSEDRLKLLEVTEGKKFSVIKLHVQQHTLVVTCSIRFYLHLLTLHST